MSVGYCPYTTVAAVRAADAFLGPDRVWSGNPGQQDWVKRFYEPIVATLVEIPEIVSNATAIAAEHVAFMKRHGWEAQVTACSESQFLTAAVMDLLVQWKEPGISRPIKAKDGKEYAGAFLEEGVEFWQTSLGAAACLATKTEDRVWLVLPPEADAVAVPIETRDLAQAAQTFLAEAKRPLRHDGLHFPMVDLAEKQTLAWIKGLSTCGEDRKEWAVLEAVQQITLKMNHEGARARAADEMCMGPTSVPPPPLVINRPFLVVFERPGLPLPLFVAYVTQESWKDPGGLGI